MEDQIFELREIAAMKICLIIAVMHTTLQLRNLTLKKIQVWTGIRTHDLCDTGGVLFHCFP